MGKIRKQTVNDEWEVECSLECFLRVLSRVLSAVLSRETQRNTEKQCGLGREEEKETMKDK